ncbi:glycosyl hydrolase 115 family protein [Sphingomonas sp.]|uniref:glycosyl hydrolase 115 family protein n=1 Tax=Sphingomonas sp. TaxID=28214 RepID=UPI002ED872E8
MHRRRWLILLAATLSMAGGAAVRAAPVDLGAVGIVADDAGSGATMPLAAQMLSEDLVSLGARTPVIVSDVAACPKTCIMIGRYDAPAIAATARAAGIDLSMLAGGWERYVRSVARTGGRQIVLIAGSDRRGAIYGAVDLTRALGVSPWSWWADVAPRRRARVTMNDATVVSRAPSVRYRGIFLNDEDWGLLPWAAKTLDPARGNIGPRTYRRVFELMWRLKANTLWPAMHSVSDPFYGDPENAALADRYAVVVGTSHAEPMMRNNLREWDEAKRGAFDFTRRPAALLDYWRERVAATRGREAIYTVGLRGIHDGPMQGAVTTEGRRSILETVIGLQQRVLTDMLKQPVSVTPQVFVAYHELQEAYDAGLSVPDDVTLMWADDNYGYLRRLSTPAEQRRPGGAGVYYHLSYWGRPHDYLWLGTTHPALIREEMERAWTTDARRMWVVNVGDIKPIEYLSQYFLDLAFDADLLRGRPQDHLRAFMREQFGRGDADAIAAIMTDFYDLAWERRPEFMGFGQTEWVTPNRPSDYVQADGEEARARLTAYAALVARAEAVAARMPEDRRDAYFELVLYPVRAAARLNTRILSLDLANLYARQDRAGANGWVDAARAAHAALVADTARYNALAGGKWRYMIDMAPRKLPVFDEPAWPRWAASTKTGCDLAYWGDWIGDENSLTFTSGQPAERTVTLYGHQAAATPWHTVAATGGLTLSAEAGMLSATNRYEQRIVVRYDGRGAAGPVALSCGGATVQVHSALIPAAATGPGVILEDRRRVLIPALAGTAGPDWEVAPDLGSQHGALRSRLSLPSRPADAVSTLVPVRYRFANVTATGAVVRVVALPTHPRDPVHGVRIAVSVDGGPPELLDLATTGRSDVWRRNVLANSAVATLPLRPVAAGIHDIQVYALDPGVLLDRIEVLFDGARPLYGGGPAPQ